MKKESKPDLLEASTPLDKIIRFCLQNQLVVILLLLLVVGWGVLVSPFEWKVGSLPRDPVPVDAIPDIGENQQIVFTKWMGRSPQDVEDQISYPMTVALLGIPGVKTIRSYSMLGFSTIYVIFKEDIDFYWSRSRILEKLNSLPSGTLPDGVKPALGPDATALGQVFWYTLEGRDKNGKPTGGWDLAELRSIQDWYVRYGLLSAEGISEVASVGGHVQEYQIDVDPDAMRAYGVGLEEVVAAVKNSNLDVGAKTIEINKVEYIIRGIGFVKEIEDLENSVIKVRENVPVFLKNIAHISLGPALRRGALDKEGAEAVGGVAVVRYGQNPLTAIQNLKQKITEISPGLPKKTLADGTVSQVKIIPFYDRTGLINETLGTLNSALSEEILVTIIVILVMVRHLMSSLLISGLLPVSVLMCFIAMKHFGVDANIVALSGIAIAIGTMVDMGIVICENILKHLGSADEDEDKTLVVYQACREVAGAVFTAVATTVVGFLPVFTLEAAEGKLFKPLAYTKSFALVASVIVAFTIIPPLARLLFAPKRSGHGLRRLFQMALVGLGVVFIFSWSFWVGFILLAIGLYGMVEQHLPNRAKMVLPWVVNGVIVFLMAILLTRHWEPLGPEKGFLGNFSFIVVLTGSVLGGLIYFQKKYTKVLSWCLEHKFAFLCIPAFFILWASIIWLGVDKMTGWLPDKVQSMSLMRSLQEKFPGLGKEFMPQLNEGSYLYMPTTMPHASIREVQDVLSRQDMALKNIPEVKSAVGKLGRAETPLDPAPVSMIETIINYYPEFIINDKGVRLTFKYDSNQSDYFRNRSGSPLAADDGEPYMTKGRYIRDREGQLIPDQNGRPFRLWRPALDPELNKGRKAWEGIRNPDDIWQEIVKVCEITGTTSAPKLQPIAARIVMLQSGIRAPMGIKIKGPDLASIEKAGMKIEKLLMEVPSVNPEAVFADRVVGKPYLEIHINRKEIARYGIALKKVQKVIEVAVGGMTLTQTVEGRERYPVRVRYMRELRDNIEGIENILVSGNEGTQIPLKQLAEIRYVRGPQVIKSEDTFLISYVLFDMKPGQSEVDVVEEAEKYLYDKMESGELKLPDGVSFTFTGSYENQVRSEERLMVILPLALFLIFIILYFQFKSAITTMLVFSGILVAWAGGFIMIWFYGQDWFMNFNSFDIDFKTLFQVRPFNLSVAVWVGFLALFGIASDNGVLLGTYLKDSFAIQKPENIAEIRKATIQAAERRVRPCLMTTATTLLALIPILTSTGKGSEIMIPMAIPSFGGMLMVFITVFTVPVLYCLVEEIKAKRKVLEG